MLAIFIVAPLVGGVAFAAEPVAPTETMLTDVQTRMLVLEKIFSLTKSEIADLRLRLENLGRSTDEQSALIYDTLNSDLKDHLQFVEARSNELSAYTTANGARATADGFKRWRETVYDPGTREIFDFLVIEQGAAILAIVDVRYQKVVSDVEKLKLTLDAPKVASLQALLADADRHLQNAHVLYNKSREIFIAAFQTHHPELAYKFQKIVDKQLAVIAVPESLSASVVDTVAPAPVPPVKPETILSTLDMSKQTVQSLMALMMAEIAATYQDFLQMREQIHLK